MMLILLLIQMLHPALADDAVERPCFDFNTKIVQALQAPPSTFEAGKDLSDSQAGTQKDSATISGLVNRPILEVYQKLLDPKTIRNASNTEVQVKDTPSKDYLKRFIESIKINATFFFTLRWDEEWAFALKNGTPEDPKTIVISYQKTEGTSHIKRLCGNMVLQAVPPKSTGVFIYQEMKADQRSAKDILNDITGTLRTLRDAPSK